MSVDGSSTGSATWRNALGTAAFAIVPLTMGGLIPWLIASHDSATSPAGIIAGAPLIVGGALLTLVCFVRFAREGHGTPAPVAPTDELVVGGPYLRVRNPMYVGVTAAIVGQALLFGDLVVVGYAALFVAVVSGFVITYEEPALTEQFGASYEAYRAAVPRWIPRLRPWQGPGDS